jgi:hypothetical protein
MEWSIIAMRENSLHGMVYYRWEGTFTPWNGLLSLRGIIHSMEWFIIAKRENSLHIMIYYRWEGEFTPWNGLLSLRGEFTPWNGLLSLWGRIHSMEWSIIAKRKNSLHGMVYYR